MTSQDRQHALSMKAAAVLATTLTTDELNEFVAMIESGNTEAVKAEMKYFAVNFSKLNLN